MGQGELFDSLPYPKPKEGEKVYTCRLCKVDLPESFFYVRRTGLTIELSLVTTALRRRRKC